MKRIFLISLVLCFGYQMVAQSQAKKYAVKSGKIVLELSGSTTGTKTIYFDNYGDRYNEHEKSVTVVKMFGVTDRTETDKITIMNGKKFWTIDNIDGDNMQGTLPYYESSRALVNNMTEAEQEKMADDILNSMGGKRLGTEDILGYECEKISLMGSVTWIYKGIVLKSEADVMGVVSNEVATEFDENANVSSSMFQAPANKNFEDIDARAQAAFGSMDMSMSMEEDDYDEEDITPVSYPFDKFQEAMNNFNPDGYARTMVMQQDGQHVAIFTQGFSNVISVMATSEDNMENEGDELDAFDSFSHKGRTMRYGDLTEDGMVLKALIIPYEEHDMYILLISSPGKSKEEMLKLADQLDF